MPGSTSSEPQCPGMQRLLRAILVIDVVESVRLMQTDEDAVIRRWRSVVEAVRRDLLPAHDGRLVKSLGDGLLLDFVSARSSFECAFAIHSNLEKQNAAAPLSEPIQLRMGVHVADVVVDDLDIFGSAVNIAARVAALAGPGEVVCTAEAIANVGNQLGAVVEDLGECFLKHIRQPVRAFRVRPTASGNERTVARLVVAKAPTVNALRPRLAILDLEVLAMSRSSMPALGSMVADELSVLTSVHSTVEVVSRMSTRRLAIADPAAVLHRLGVHFVISGSCAVSASTALVRLEISHLPENGVVWAHSMSVPLQALIAQPGEALAEVCWPILNALEAHETGRARSTPLASLDSYSLFLGGLRLMYGLSHTDFDKAKLALEALTDRHPRHPVGFAWLAKWHILEMHQGWSQDLQLSAQRASDMARRALDHDDRCGIALVVSGMVRTFNDRNLDEAEKIYLSALESNPSESLAWLLKGVVHAFRGEGEAAVRHTRRAMDLSPLDPMRYYFESLSASAEASAGNYGEAISLALRSLKSNGAHASTLRILTIAYAMLDRMDEARSVVQKLLELEPGFTVAKFLARSPSSDFPIGRLFATALARAGVPR